MSNINDKIRQLLNKKCEHAIYYHKKPDSVCNKIMELMYDAFNTKEYIDYNLVNKFWKNYLLGPCYLKGYYYYSDHKTKTRRFIEQLCLYRKPSTSVLEILLKNKQTDQLYGYIVLGENFTKFDEDDIQAFCSRLNYHHFGNDDIGNIIINNIEETVSVLVKLILAKSKIIANWLYAKIIELKLIDNTNDLIQLEVIQNNICCNIDYHRKLFEYLLGKGIEFTKEHTILICSHGDIESINLVYQNLRFEITREHFNAICLSSKQIFDYNTIPVIKTTYTPDKAELMFKYGYKLDIEDVKFIIHNRIEIRDIDRFGLELGEEILTLCGKHDFYPTYKFNKSDPGLVELYKLTRKKNVVKLRTFYKSNKTVPDAICMDNVCSIYDNTASYNVLIEHGGKITYKNIETVARVGPTSFIRLVISDYKETENNKDKQINELKREINDLKKEINSLKNNKKTNSKYNETLQQMIDKIQKDNEIFRQQQDHFNNLTTKKNPDNNDNTDNEKSKEESNNKLTHKSKHKTKSTLTHNYKKECNKAITFNISDETILKTKEQYKCLSNVPLSIKDIDLKLNGKMNYSDLKIHIINHFKDKKWIHENLIKIPLDARLLLNIIDGNYINIGDIDKFVTYLYNFKND